MLELLLIATLVVTLFYINCIKPMYHWRKLGIKSTPVVWIAGDNWGNALKLESFADMVKRVYNQVPGARYSGMYQFTTPTLVIRDLELIKRICVKDFDHFVDHRSFVSEEADPTFGKNIFSLKGQRWRDTRPLLSRLFTNRKIKGMYILMTKCAESLTNHFSKQMNDIVELDMRDASGRFTNDIIASTTIGVSVDSFKDPTNEYYLLGKRATDFSSLVIRIKFFGFFLFPKLTTMLRVPLIDAQASKFFNKLMMKNIKMRREKGIVRGDMIDVFLEAQKGKSREEENHEIYNGHASVEESDLNQNYIGKSATTKLTDFDIIAQAMEFYLAGFETTSSVITFMAYELMVNPDIQNRLRNEIIKTLNDCNGTVTYEALLKMKYMDMVLAETLRKWPGAVSVDRLCTKPYTIEPVLPGEKPLHLAEGDIVLVPIFGLHRDPELFPDPERFDPERFNDENRGSIEPYSYLPFGVGPRNCIGNRFGLLSVKVLFFHLLKAFELVPVDKTEIPVRISKSKFGVDPDGGLPLGLKKIGE
ncbi:unnamed protein product [Phyllotreta striolata]|uniref:Cytochrome P450 monooxygenase n=1 Tax=Phyllotreta striolata TaxID=444603 RepID=A0A9N9TL63_PHYSR|nr:unnamed protein product [Phyllotreta striolata]